MAYTLDGNNLGSIQSETVKKTAQITPLPLPLSDSNQTDVFDFGGVIRTISLTTVKSGNTAALQSLITALNNILDGDQVSTVPYVSDLFGTINVKLMDVSFTYVAGKPLTMTMSIRLVESSSRG